MAIEYSPPCVSKIFRTKSSDACFASPYGVTGTGVISSRKGVSISPYLAIEEQYTNRRTSAAAAAVATSTDA